MAEIILQKSGGGVSSDEVTATRAHVLAPYTAVTKDSNDEPVAGTIQSMGAQTVTPALGAQAVASSGKYMTGNVTVNPIPNQRGTAVQGVGCGVNANGLYYYIPPGYYQEGANNPWVFMPVVNAANAIGVQSVVSFSVAAYSTTQVICTWRNPSKGPYGGVLICAKAGGYPNSAWDGITYQGVGNNSALNGNSSVVMSGLNPGTTYYFRIWMYCAYNGGTLYSNYLQTACATTASGYLAFTSSGTWTVPAGVRSIDIHCTGGGASGNGAFEVSVSDYAGQGGCGGFTSYKFSIPVIPGEQLVVEVGQGDPGSYGYRTEGGISKVSRNGSVLLEARGGVCPNIRGTGTGGSGGGATTSNASNARPGYGGSDGGDGTSRSPSSRYQGKGQRTTTREFGTGTLYSGGGGGGTGNRSYDSDGSSGGQYNNPDYIGLGGAGGGGNGGKAYYYVAGSSGAHGTGGGGGGGCRCGSNKSWWGWSGGSGNVIIKWS